jgi:hypothetical protein
LSDFVTTSSANEFHAPHEGHLPSHFADSYPQLLQKNNVFAFAIITLEWANKGFLLTTADNHPKEVFVSIPQKA